MKRILKPNKPRSMIYLVAILAGYALLTCLLTLPNATQAQDGQVERELSNKRRESELRVALVIGNADYDASVGKLKNPANDATDIAAALARLGFKLVGGKPQLNLNKRRMLELIREFGSQIGKGGVGVFYFAGHGVQIDKRNYLIPITTLIRTEEDVDSEGVNVDEILRQMEYAENSLNIMILDACRNNDLPRRTRNTVRGLGEPNKKPSGIYIAFAARDGQVALENPRGRNGLYTQELLKNLETPNLRLEDIFINTRREVKRLSRLSGQMQEPIEYGSLDYVYFFNPITTVSAQSSINPLPNATLNNPSLIDEKASTQPSPTLASAAIIIPYLKGNLYGFSNVSRKQVIEAKYYDVSPFDKEGLARVNLNGKYGYIDKTGTEVISLKYDNAGSFNEGLALVNRDKKYGYIDMTGTEVISLKYDRADSFSERLAPVKRNDKWGYIDKTGTEVIPLNYDDAGSFNEGLALVRLNYKWFYIDQTGKEVISLKQFSYCFVGSFFREELVNVCQNGKYGYIDKAGKEVIPFKYDDAGSFSEGLARVKRGYRYGYIDKAGKEVISFKYESAGSFSEGLAAVKQFLSWGYINKTSAEVIPFKYDDAGPFSRGLARVMYGNKTFYIDKNGTEYYEP
jgi:hypothetical protein